MTAGDGLIRPVKNEDVADDAAIDESKLDFNEMSGHDHDGAASKKVDSSNTVYTPAGTIVAMNVQAAINELDSDATLIRNDIDYPTAVKQKAITDTGEDGGVEGGVFNGDFEYGSGSRSTSGWIGDDKYGVHLITVNSTMLASFDNTVSHSGTQSLKLSTTDATGSGAARTANVAIEYASMAPLTKYRLSGWIKTDNAAVDSVYIRIPQYDLAGNIGTIPITSKLSGTNDWTYLEVVFTSDADAALYKIDYFNIVVGNISDAWFDDIKLEQIDTQAVNTQTDEIVSVSVEGVTTTDNIDQYLETSGNTYTLTTGIDEGATHRQTFTPTADRGDGKHILTKIQALVAAIGTGDWTLVVHDAANNVLASTTIVNGSMSTGDIDFDVPAILGIGTAYHFHIYSTVADGTVTTTDNADLETVDYHAQFAKHTESPVISANGGALDMTGVKLLTGATITVNADGSGICEYVWSPSADGDILNVLDIHEISAGGYSTGNMVMDAWGVQSDSILSLTGDRYIIWKCTMSNPITHIRLIANDYMSTDGDGLHYYDISKDGSNWIEIASYTKISSENQYTDVESDAINGSSTVFIRRRTPNGKINYGNAARYVKLIADLDCQAALPIFIPSTEVTTETSDLTLNPIDISEDGYLKLNSDLTGWGSRTFTMLASEAAFESQAVSANYIYMYDSNGTTPWSWDERSGLVPPADRTSGTVTAKFLVGDNQIRSSVNDGSMKVNVNLSWNEESLRAAINRLNALANLQYPIVVEVEDVPAIDLQDQPTGASAETGYTNDVTSLRQTTAGVAAIAYTGLLPRENQFSEWLDITVVCSDGDGTLQGKLYTVDGTLVETYADLESNPVIEISNPDYKYSRERLILQISASLETTGTAWSVTDVKWRYQYDGV